MNYQLDIVINKSLTDVIRLFEDPKNLGEWQEGFVNIEHLAGTPGENGAISRMVFDERNREIVMMETIIENSLPQRFAAQYEADGVHNININRFEPLGENQTRWMMDTTFTFSGFMRLMALFMRGAFKQQTQKTMQAFKEFAERT